MSFKTLFGFSANKSGISLNRDGTLSVDPSALSRSENVRKQLDLGRDIFLRQSKSGSRPYSLAKRPASKTIPK